MSTRYSVEGKGTSYHQKIHKCIKMEEMGIREVFPVNPFHLSLYLCYLIQKAASVEEAVWALSWVHAVALEIDPTEHDLVRQVLAGAKHMLAKNGANYCEHPAIIGR